MTPPIWKDQPGDVCHACGHKARGQVLFPITERCREHLTHHTWWVCSPSCGFALGIRFAEAEGCAAEPEGGAR